MYFIRKHGKLFIGENSVDQTVEICKNYKNPLLLVSPSAHKNPALKNILNNFSNTMIKDSGEPTDLFIDEFVFQIKVKPDVIVAIGGGSLIDFAKVVAVLLSNPTKHTKEVYGITDRNKAVDLIAVPTTAGTGTEVTGVSVVIDSKSGLKFGVLGDDIVPKYAILDPTLSTSLNLRYTISTGVDALTHALEAFCSKNAFYMTDLYASQSIKIIWETLPLLKDDLKNTKLREKMLYASMLAGLAFGTAGTGAVHGFAHIVGGKYNISHGEANSIFLAPVMWYNFKYNKDKIRSLYKNIGYEIDAPDDFSRVIKEFLNSVGAPLTFKDVNVNNIKIDDIYGLMPKQKRLFEKTMHNFTYEDVKKVINSLL